MKTTCRPRTNRGSLRNGLVHLVRAANLDWVSWSEPRLMLHVECRPASFSDKSWGTLLPDTTEITCAPCREIQRARDLGATHPNAKYTYYGLRGDGLVKIGVSKTPGLRCSNLKLRLLAIELSAGNGSEYARHLQFRADRVEGEYFQPTQVLHAHIDSLVAASGDTLESLGWRLSCDEWMALPFTSGRGVIADAEARIRAARRDLAAAR